MSITPKHALIKGAAWTVGMRWAIRILGFLNTVIMARILAPADYGIVAMAYLIIGLIQALVDFGATTALLRKDEVTRDEIDSAWTLRLIQGAVIGLLLAAFVPLAAWYFNEPRIEAVLLILGACVAISNAGNIGPTLAQKEFNFALDFKIQVIQKLVSVIVTIIAGLFLGDYRALVIGIAAMYAVSIVLSYSLHPYRPKWNTSRIPEIWSVTKWLMFSGVGGYILNKGDELTAARIGSTAEYGQYTVGADLGQSPVGEVGPAMLRALLPVLASIKEDIVRTRHAVIKTVSALNTVIWPLGVGFAAIAPQATELILGNKWIESASYIGAFAIASVLKTSLSPLSTLLILQGHTKTQMHVVWLEFGAFIAASIILVPSMHLIGLVYARIFGSIVNLTSTAIFAKKYCHLRILPVIAALTRPILGAIILYIVVQSIVSVTSGVAVQVILSVISGIVVYSLWCLMSWYLTGRHEGLESTVIDFITARYKSSKN